jgi:hypothetical protein
MKQEDEVHKFLRIGAWGILSTITLGIATASLAQLINNTEVLVEHNVKILTLELREERIYNELKLINSKMDRILEERK